MTLYADALAALVALSLFLLFFYGPWQEIVVDVSRQIVFEKRDAVFDLAASGKLEFESTDYKIIRDSLNKLIRFAHELNWVRLAMWWNETQEEAPETHQAIERIADPETRAKVSTYLQEARFAMIGMMAAKSLPILLAAIVIGIISWCMGKTRNLFLRLDNAIGRKMEAEAEAA